MNNMNNVNIGIIGFGVMGKIRFDNIKSVRGKHRVSSICDANAERNMQLKDIKFTVDYNEILQDKDINVVFVCTPSYLNNINACVV
ncbi:unnamed protein product, partial [marine sediment metagenome]